VYRNLPVSFFPEAQSLKKSSSPPSLPPKKSKKFDFAWFLTRRLKTILIGGGAIFTLLLPFAVLKGNYSFETGGKLLIAREAPKITGSNDEYTNLVNYFHDYAKTQVERIKSLENLEAALKSLPDELRLHFQPGNMDLPLAAAILQKNLEASEMGGTHLIQVKLKGGAAAGLAEMVNAIMNTYIQKLGEESESRESRRLSFLSEERDNLKKEIEKQTEQLEIIVQQTMSSDFNDSTNVNLQKFLIFQDSYLKAYFAKVSAGNQYQQTEAESTALKKVPNKVLAEEMVAGDQSIWRTSSWTYEKLQELRATVDGVTKENPDRQYIENRMKGMEEYERRQREAIRQQSDRIINEKRNFELTKKNLAAQYEYLSKVKTAADLKAELDQSKDQLKISLQAMMEGRQLTRSIENSRKKYFDLENRIRDLMLEAKTPLLVSVESYAIPPTSPSSSNKKKLVMMSLAMSFGLVAGILLAIDFTDNRVHSPHDLTNYLGTPPNWPISNYVSDPPGRISFENLALKDMDNKVARALGSLAVRLDKERHRFDAKIGLFTGVDEASGVTAISLNTAQIMKRFCHNILLIDANTVNPELMKIEGIPSTLEPPLSQLSSIKNSNLSIYRDQERQLDFLSLAHLDWGQDGAGRLVEILHDLRQKYDFILIDSEPILKSDFTEMLIVLADVVVLIVQGDRTLFKDFVRSTEIILRLEVKALATVLNWGGPKPMAWSDQILQKITDREWLEGVYQRLLDSLQLGRQTALHWWQKVRMKKNG
jgi:polysaccharide biosynthesis transport protein